MGMSTNSHDKKSDKGTQSPLLKIFKEIMMREKHDSEKKSLLPNYQEQNEDRKRKQYSSRHKTDRRSNDSTSSEQRRKSPYKGSTAESRVNGNVQESHYSQFQTENKDSWLNWKSKNQKPLPIEPDEETCSCASCALRRLVNSEYIYIICLILIFVISIIAASILVFNNIPIVSTRPTQKKGSFDIEDSRAESDRLKRRIDENREKNELGGVFGKFQYDDILRHDPMNIPVSSDIDFGPSFRELTGIDDEVSKSNDDMELANFLEPEKIEVQANDKLREFYKKLVQTDAKIKKLRKISNVDSYFNNNNNYEIKTPDRFRRSLKLYPRKYHIRRRRGLFNKSNVRGRKKMNLKRLRRFGNSTASEPTAFVLEKKKLIVQYEPAAKKKVPKCSHNPKESNHHETELKHPFYQNTQRLDELLDRFFNKNLPEIMTDPFGLDVLFEERKNKCKHPNINQKLKSKSKNDKSKTSEPIKSNVRDDKSMNDDKNRSPGYMNLVETLDEKAITIYTRSYADNFMTTEHTTNYEQKLYNDEAKLMAKEKNTVMTADTTEFQVLLSVSTLMNSKLGKPSNHVTTVPLIDRVPQIRRLMQADEEEENLGYDDFKEVLTDDMENQDDIDRRADRKKRDQEKTNKDSVPSLQDEAFQLRDPIETVPKVVKFNPPGLHNPNWKGPMPLYPDELNSMVQHAAMSANKLEKIPPVTDLVYNIKDEMREKKRASDVDYIEDYLDNRYDKLVEMAQAYSDYGVLEGKKDTQRNDKNQATENISPGVRVKLSASGNFLSRGLLGRMKKAGTSPVNQSVKEQNAAISRIPHDTDQSSEGFRIEIRPSSETRDDEPNFTQMLPPHFKVNPNEESSNVLNQTDTTDIVFNPKTYTDIIEQFKTMQPSKDIEDYIMSKGLIFTVRKGRALLSKESDKYENYVDVDYKIINDDDITNSTAKNNNFEIRNQDLMIYEVLPEFADYLNKSNNDNMNSTTVGKTRVVDNIGYKSREFMTINDDNTTDDEGKSVKEYIDVTGVKSMNISGDESNRTATSTIATNLIIKNKSTVPMKARYTISNLAMKRFGRKVKRNADNSNLIFWNDIYDDEYGVQTNNLDNVKLGDKYARIRNDFIKRSGRWVQEKIKKIAENLKRRDQELDTKKRIVRDAGNIGLGQYPKYLFNKMLKRDSKIQNNYESDQKAMFSTLGANLALVCKKAANSVQHLRNIEVKEDSKQGTIATSLMQQLVGLLTEIVDYQVQQKTCAKLPPDLQKYLEWLTLPEYDSKNVKMPDFESPTVTNTATYATISYDISEEGKISESNQLLETPLSNEKDDQKTKYLDTIKSVEDLMEEYRMMNDEDKSKMTGVQYYLENQLNYLKNEIGTGLYDNYGNTNLYLRYKRDHPNYQKRKKRKLQKFIKNFGKKHTRTTVGFYDGIAVTEMKKHQENIDTVKEKRREKNLHSAVSKGVKRNLKDVYYHALAEAKKYTRAGLKTANTAGFSTTQSVKLHSYNQDVSRLKKAKLTREKSNKG